MGLLPSSESPRKPEKTILKKTFVPKPHSDIITNDKEITVTGRIVHFSKGSGARYGFMF